MAVAARLLTIDRGNTNLALCCHRDGGSGPVQRLPAGDVGAVAAAVAAALAGGIDRAAAVTVVASGLAAVSEQLRAGGVALGIAGVDLPCPLQLRYDTPATLGADRWVAALAACRELGDAVVVDCGTAVTVDVVTADGTFLGGAIAPGLATQVAGLSARAPALPPFSTPSTAYPGTSSAACVDVGATLAFVGGVDRLVAAALAALPGAPVVATGGDAALWRRASGHPSTLVDDLVHRGLRWLLRGCGSDC